MRAPKTLAILALALSCAACEYPVSNVTVEQNEEESKGTVSLPPAPAPADFVIKEKNDDGTLRVLGIIEYKDKYLEKQVTLTAHIASVSPECDPAEAKKTNAKCDEPNMIIMDDPDADARLLVVGFEHAILKKKKIAEGETHTLAGTYKTMALGFTDTESGVLQLESIDGNAVVDTK